MIASIDGKVQEIQFVEASSGYGKGRDYLVHAPYSNRSQCNNAGHYVSRDDFESLRDLAKTEQRQHLKAWVESREWQDMFYESNKIIQSLQKQLAEVATSKDRASERFAAENMEAREWKERATEWREAHETLMAEREEYRHVHASELERLMDIEKSAQKIKVLIGIMDFNYQRGKIEGAAIIFPEICDLAEKMDV